MPLTDYVKLISEALVFLLPYLVTLLARHAFAVVHGWTWRNKSDAKNVVVIGGSFAGVQVVSQLANTLPTGYKVVLIEKNSHLHYVFNFPRFSVLTGWDRTAFIPYDGLARGAPTGIFTRIQDTASGLTPKQVLLSSGGKIDYAYLIIATGSCQPFPVNLKSTERDEACLELQEIQGTIQRSRKIAVVGGGAVGVELASDIKDFYPDKEVTLVHSRDRLLTHFGPRLQTYVEDTLRNELGIEVLLNERPEMPPIGEIAEAATLTFSNSRQDKFDLVIGCTGQRPNSAILSTLLADAVSKTTSRIIVRPTLQIITTDTSSRDLPIFAFGDVAGHGGPRMARAGWLQADVVAENILAMIQKREPTRKYKPNVFIEGAIKLTLGKTHVVTYAMDDNGSEVLIPSRKGQLDLGIKQAWKLFGADVNKECGDANGR